MGLGGLTWHHKEVGMKWQFDDWERWFSWGLVMKHWEFSQSSAMVNNWDFTFKIQAFLPCRCCLDSCGWRNLSTNNGMVNVVHLHMHSSSPEQNLPDFQVHKTLDSLDATGAVSDIPPKKIRCVWACLSWCFCPFFAGPRDGPWDGRTLWWSLWRTRWSRLRRHALWSRGLLKGWSNLGGYGGSSAMAICVKNPRCFEVLVNLAWTYHLTIIDVQDIIGYPHHIGVDERRFTSSAILTWKAPVLIHGQVLNESSGSTSDFWSHWRGWNPDISDK